MSSPTDRDSGQFSRIGSTLVWLAPLALAGLLRAAFHLVNHDSPFFAAPLVDAKAFHDQAVLVATGQGLPPVPYDRPPLLLYVAALLYAIFGESPRVVLVAHAVLGAATAVLTAVLGARLLGRAVGLTAGLLLAVARLPVVLEGQILNETIQAFLLVGCALALTGRSIAAGAALAGLAVLARPTSAFFVLPMLLVALVRWDRVGGRLSLERGIGTTAVAFALFGAVSGAAFVRNLVVSGEPVLVSANGGINFFVGNATEHDALVDIRPGLSWERLVQSPRALERDDVFPGDPYANGYGAWDAGYWRAGLDDIARDLPAAAGRWLRKAFQFWSAREIERNVHAEAFVSRANGLSWVTLPFAVLGPLALAGVALLVMRRRPGGGPVLLGIGAAWLTVVVFFVTSRYRMPAYPFLAIAAGVFLIETGRALRRIPHDGGPWRPLIALAAALALAVADPGRAREIAQPRPHYLLGAALEDLGRDAEAVVALERALAEQPDDPDVLFALATARLRRGNLSRAIALARRATDAMPDHPAPLHTLGLAEALAREDDAAVATFRRYLELQPTDAVIHFERARSLARLGREEEARGALAEAFRLAPRAARQLAEAAPELRELLGE